MSDNGDKKSSEDSKEDKVRRNWHEAKDFVIRDSGMYDVGDNANFKLSESHIHARTVMIVDRLTIRASHADREANVAQVSHGSRDELEVPQITLVETPGSTDELEAQTTLVHMPTPLQTNSGHSTSSPNPVNTFEPEATADYTDPDVPFNLSTAYSHTSRARTHIYSLGMLTHGAGYPLYMPAPSIGLPPTYREKGIRVGDVGVITANGAFEFLFNVCHDEGIDATIFPDGFEPLMSDIRTNPKFSPDTYLPSDHVDEVDDHDSSTAFRCLTAEGAVLALPKGATVYEARNRRDFQTYAARHAICWYNYMLNVVGMDVLNGSLYFVTESTKSMDWGIAVFYAQPTAEHYLRFIVDGETYRWVRRGKVEARVGSKSTDDFDCDSGEPNQCVFLRGYKIMLRQDIWDKLNGATVVKSQDGHSSSCTRATYSHDSSHGASGSQTDSFHQSPSHESSMPGPSHYTGFQAHTRAIQGNLMRVGDESILPQNSSDQKHGSGLGQVILEESFREKAPLHPSDLINLLLLHLKPEAKIALAHDDEWSDQLPHDFIADPVNPNVDGLLENIKRSYTAVVDQYETAVLVNTATARPQMLSLGSTYKDLTGHVWKTSNLCFAMGGFADVYNGIYQDESGLQHRVAIKIVRGVLKITNERISTAQRLNREARVWHALKHPNVLEFLGIVHNMGEFFALVSPYCSKGNIARYLEEYPQTNRLHLILGVANAIEYLHKNYVIHGNIRSANILIADDGRPLLHGFGCSKIINESGFTTPTWNGSVRYMAPELLIIPDKSDDDDNFITVMKETDVYSFSMVGVEILSGKQPYPEIQNNNKIMMRVPEGLRPKREEYELSRLHTKIWDILEFCWVNDPAERLTMSMIVQQLSYIRDEPAIHIAV